MGLTDSSATFPLAANIKSLTPDSETTYLYFVKICFLVPKFIGFTVLQSFFNFLELDRNNLDYQVQVLNVKLIFRLGGRESNDRSLLYPLHTGDLVPF